MNARTLTVIVAVVFALGTAVLTILFLGSMREKQTQASATVPVLVANQDIEAHNPLLPAMFHIVQRPKSAVDPDAMSNANALSGNLSLINIPAGSALLSTEIGEPADVGLSAQLEPGQRAISISVDLVKDVSGLVEPGDRVDVLAEAPALNGYVQHAVAILRGILVLSIGGTVNMPGATPPPGVQNAATVTLAVTPQQATTLFTADQNATLRLALRSPKEPVDSEPTQQLVFDTSGATLASAGSSSVAPPMGPVAPMNSALGAPPPSRPEPTHRAAASAQTFNGVTLINGATVTAP